MVEGLPSLAEMMLVEKKTLLVQAWLLVEGMKLTGVLLLVQRMMMVQETMMGAGTSFDCNLTQLRRQVYLLAECLRLEICSYSPRGATFL